MEASQDGGSISHPPLLDGSNYPYWKAKMTAFLKSVDSKTWKYILRGWNYPTQAATKGERQVIKLEVDSTPTKDEPALGNDKALKAIFNVVDQNVFKMISKCTVDKEAWEILQTAYEGTPKVRMSRLQQLTTKWETVKIEEDETITTYSTRINDMANEAFALGEGKSNEKKVRKVLRSLPKRFKNKVIAIEEAQDLSNMKSDELIENLTTFEIKMDSIDTIKKKGIALKASCKDGEEQDLAETINLLAKFFSKTMKRFNKKPYVTADSTKVNDRWFDNWKKNTKIEGTRNYDGENEDVKDTVSNFMPFTATISKEDNVTPTVNHSACHDNEHDGEINEEELMINYQMLFDKWSMLTKAYTLKEAERQKLEQANSVLLKIVEVQKYEIGVLEGKVESMTKEIKMMKSSTNILDKILEKGNRGRDASGISYLNLRRQQTVTHQKWVVADSKQHQSKWRRYHCGKKGHIAPYRYKVYGRGKRKYSQPRMEWLKKTTIMSYVVFTSLRQLQGKDGTLTVDILDT
ncbi:hypothetical protein LIER_18163 [Lithospermum erythrorhizon]|uniref:Gag-pol polyprotein n=1 Tax=Lithospermum erythrorhizon TaxID=34254 RepID=A0AAV3QFK4_LITER